MGREFKGSKCGGICVLTEGFKFYRLQELGRGKTLRNTIGGLL